MPHCIEDNLEEQNSYLTFIVASSNDHEFDILSGAAPSDFDNHTASVSNISSPDLLCLELHQDVFLQVKINFKFIVYE